jgi:hypothetical protein
VTENATTSVNLANQSLEDEIQEHLKVIGRENFSNSILFLVNQGCLDALTKYRIIYNFRVIFDVKINVIGERTNNG